MIGSLVAVGVVALLLGACLGWLERGRRCRAAHAHLVPTHLRADLDTFLGPGTEPTPEPTPRPTPEPEVRPGQFVGSALPGPDGSAPGPTYVVKAKLRSRIYHTAASASFAQTIPEVWFSSVDDAEAAGFRPPRQGGRRGASTS